MADTAPVRLRAREIRNIKDLPDFDRQRGHFVPARISEAVDRFAARLFEGSLREETRLVYEGAKTHLGLRRRDLKRSVEGGVGAVSSRYFRYEIRVGQNPDNPKQVVVLREWEIPEEVTELPPGFDDIFPVIPDELVLPLGEGASYDHAVERLEDVRDQAGGVLEEDEDRGLIRFLSPEGFLIEIHHHSGEMIFRSPHVFGCRALWGESQRRWPGPRLGPGTI